MDQVKSALASKTVWAGIVAFGAGVAGLLGHQIAPADQVATVDFLAQLVTAVSGLVAVWGRVTATKRIG